MIGLSISITNQNKNLVPAPEPDPDLLAFYKLTANLNDSSENNNTLTDNNGPTLLNAEGAEFNNTNYLSHPVLILSTPWSISLWVIKINNGDTNDYIKQINSSLATLQGIGSNGGWFGYADQVLGLEFELNNDILYFVVLTYDGTKLRMYINGHFEGQLDSTATYTDLTELLIGQGSISKIKYVGIWSKTLLQLEITTLFNGGVPLDPTV